MQRKVLPLIAALLFSAIPSVQAATAQVGFSPEGTAQVLVLDVIHTAKHDIRMMALLLVLPPTTFYRPHNKPDVDQNSYSFINIKHFYGEGVC